MANPNPSSQPPTTPEPESEPEANHWCHTCDKRVTVESPQNSADNLVCSECKTGFVESLSHQNHNIDSFGPHFLQAINLLANQTDNLHHQHYLNALTDDDVRDDDDHDDDLVPEIDEDDLTPAPRDALRLRLGGLSTGRRSRVLDWAEILLHLEDESLGFRLDFPYVGNPGDYVDGAEFDALLQSLAESDGRRGPPPAAKDVVAGLKKETVDSEDDTEVCAVCKDAVSVGEIVTKLPCGHGYHGDCIVPWLGTRNNCPVCRFELLTDDKEYEEEKKKKKKSVCASGSSSSN